MSLLKLLSADTRRILDEFLLSMELWDLLEARHYSICDYDDKMNWDISGEGEPDNELWKRNSYHAYTCAVITMGNALGIYLEYGWVDTPSPEEHCWHLTRCEAVNSRVVTQCFVAFLELHRPEIENHGYAGEAISLLEWRKNEGDEPNDVLWALDDVVGWKRLAIENALETAEL